MMNKLGVAVMNLDLRLGSLGSRRPSLRATTAEKCAAALGTDSAPAVRPAGVFLTR